MTQPTTSEFLTEIEIEKNKWYEAIDDIFVSPGEYDEIKDTLRSDKIVFITGTKEYGKTYTAIRILWEYYNEGYKPKYIHTRHEDKIDVRSKLVAIDSVLEQLQIVYFDDPFGKIKPTRILKEKLGLL